MIDILEESLSVPCRGADIPSVLAYPLAGAPRGAALVAGPHPLMGGGLQNNVVCAVARGMAEHGYVSLRFAYGGGQVSRDSMQEFWRTGCAPEDPARVDEARVVLSRLRSVCDGPIVLIGYSFGASVIGSLHPISGLERVVLIGPTFPRHALDALQCSTLAKLVITGDNDFATPLERTRAWFANASSPKKLVVIPSAEHFYRGHEARLVAEIIDSV